MAKRYKEKTKKTLKQKLINIIYVIILLTFVLMFIISVVNIIKWYLGNKENQKIQKEISQSITVKEDEENIQDKYIVNFEDLKQKNPDTVGWLKVNGTEVEYTVVQSSNNDYYLTHNFEKKYNKSGWIFADYKNKLDGTDKNLVIYGHNIRDDSMFGTLKNVIKEEWYNNPENYKIILITENAKTIYEVFSVYQIENEDYYIQTNFTNETEFEKFINTVKSRSVKEFKIELTGKDNILTLSTCANNNKYRVVLHAKKISNEEEI